MTDPRARVVTREAGGPRWHKFWTSVVERGKKTSRIAEVCAEHDALTQALRDAETHLNAGSVHDALLTIRAALAESKLDSA